MFIGHFAVGFAARRLAPGTSLGLLIGAPIALDLLWPAFVLAGWEEVRIDPGNTAFTPLAFVHYPWSHSLRTPDLADLSLIPVCRPNGDLCLDTPFRSH